MKVLITGAAGFLGSALGERLQQFGNKVTGIDNYSHPCKREIDFCIEMDVRDEKIEKLIEENDIVFHLAAEINVDESLLTPLSVTDVNFLGTMNVLEAVRKFDKRMIFASTSEVYGTAQQRMMRETHALNPQSAYAASKAAADRMCYAYWHMYKTKVAILRNFNTFGPYQREDSYGGVIAKFCKWGSEGKPLQVYGDGEQTRDYMWVDDAVNAYITLADQITPFSDDVDIMYSKPYGQVFNAGTGKEVSVNRIAEIISKHYNVPIEHTEPRKGEVQRLCADAGRIKELDWKPTTDFETHLTQYINWYDSTL